MNPEQSNPTVPAPESTPSTARSACRRPTSTAHPSACRHDGSHTQSPGATHPPGGHTGGLLPAQTDAGQELATEVHGRLRGLRRGGQRRVGDRERIAGSAGTEQLRQRGVPLTVFGRRTRDARGRRVSPTRSAKDSRIAASAGITGRRRRNSLSRIKCRLSSVFDVADDVRRHTARAHRRDLDVGTGVGASIIWLLPR